MKKISVLILAMMMMFSIVLTGYNQGTKAETTEYKDTIIVGRLSEGVAFDPYVSIDTSTLEVCVQIYDTLVMMNDKMEIVPMLAESWNFTDDLTLEMKLKKGVKFHNGAEMKAEDVKFSIDRMVTSKAAGYIFNFLDSVEVKDEYTVVFKTKKPFAPILAHLSHPAASIYCKAYVEEKGEAYGQSPIGTGAYKFVEWKQGDRVKLEAFEDHFRGVSPTKTLIFRAIPEASQRTIGLETGELDIAYDILPTDVSKLKENDSITVEVKPGLRYNYLGLNTKKAPFDNIKVRQAIAYAVDKQSIADVIFEGAASTATSPCPPLSFGASQDVESFKLDKEKSKALLAEAGFPNGFKTTLWCRDDQIITEVAQVIQSNLKEVGIDVKIEIMEWGAYLDKTAKGEQEMYILGWTNVTGDANYILYGLFATAQFGVAGNRAFYSNPRVDELLELGVSTTDPAKRTEYYAEMQKIVTEETPLVSLYYQNIITGYNKKVENFVPAPTCYHKLFNVKVAK